MALINLKTNLKSLKYGRDTVNGGNSGQPYIIKPIPESWSQIGNTGGYDSFVRGGSLILGKTADDTSRLLQFLTRPNSQQGFLFTTKLQTLSNQSVKTQVNTGKANQGDSSLENILKNVAGSSIQKHFNLFATENYTTFINSEKGKDTQNRLLSLTKTKVNPKVDSSIGTNSNNEIVPGRITLIGVDEKQAFLNAGYTYDNTVLYSYNQGFQRTDIKLTNPTVHTLSNYTAQNNYISLIGGNEVNGRNLLLQLVEYKATIKNTPKLDTVPNIDNNPDRLLPPNVEPKAPRVGSSAIQGGTVTGILDFRSFNTGSRFGFQTGSYVRNKIFGDPGAKVYGTNPNTNDAKNAYVANPTSTDLVNFKYIYSTGSTQGAPDPVYDYVDFHIAVYSNATEKQYRRTHIHFTALLSGLTNNYLAEWEAHRVMGRGENFYTYQGFTRDLTFNFDVHAQTKPELLRQKYKLDYLTSLIYPDYSAAGVMQGTFVELTIGDWIYQEPGIITGFTYVVPDESPWQIQSLDLGAPRRAHEWNKTDWPNYEDESVLPHLIKVQGFKFIPIGKQTPRRWNPDDIWKQQLDPTKPKVTPLEQDAANAINTNPKGYPR